MDRSESVKKALSAFSARAAKKSGLKRRNKSPEKDVERECVLWMRARGWDVQIISSKAQYNPKVGRYVSQAVTAGTVDCIGTMPDGTFVAIEFKAPTNMKQFNRPHNIRQKEYIRSKILSNAFGCVVDSAKLLESIYESWKKIEGAEVKRTYLFSKLP